MKRNLLLLTVMMFALGSVLSAAEPTVKKPFNGTNFDGWQFKSITSPPGENCWQVGGLNADAATFELTPLKESEKGCMLNMVDLNWNNVNPRKGLLVYTEENFGDCTIKLEFLIPKGSNSGIYLMGEYEVQIQDSFARPVGRPLGQGDMGAIYSAAAPIVNASGVPGTWQKYEIEFAAPQFDASGNKTSNARFKKITLNGVVVQENVEVQGPTGGGLTMKEAATGPLMFQGDHGPVAFRNIEIIVP